MELYPAIDLYEGKVVRLTRGDFQNKKVYSDSPEDIALEWQNQGAKWIHVVDLEGAKSGIPINTPSVQAIIKRTKCRLQLGGGIRSLETIERMLHIGVSRVIMGTKALDEAFLQKVIQKFGDQVAVGLDTRNGLVQTQGWLSGSGILLQKFIPVLNQVGVSTLIYTDIQKDGMMSGPNWEGLEEVLSLSKSKVILSGGIATLEDIKHCRSIKHSNFHGVILGKSLYEKSFLLSDAFKELS